MFLRNLYVISMGNHNTTINYRVKNQIKSLDINTELKNTLLTILSESESDSEESNIEELLQIKDKTSSEEYSTDSKSREELCLCKNKNVCTCKKTISTLTREEKITI
jgi:hypothetical protein